MKRVNIMIEVNDDLYDSVVLPRKQSRKFSKFLISLLESYRENDYIAQYVEGNLDKVEKEDMMSFEEVISSMNKNLSNIGMIVDCAESNTIEGMNTIKDIQKEAETDVFSKELSKMKEDMDSMKEDNKKIFEMLSTLCNTMAQPQIESKVVVSEQELEEKERRQELEEKERRQELEEKQRREEQRRREEIKRLEEEKARLIEQERKLKQSSSVSSIPSRNDGDIFNQPLDLGFDIGDSFDFGESEKEDSDSDLLDNLLDGQMLVF